MLHKYTVELTDTFAGEANYSWVRRITFWMPENHTDLQLVRRAKKLLGINGVRTKTQNYGELMQLMFPRNTCTTAFIYSALMQDA